MKQISCFIICIALLAYIDFIFPKNAYIHPEKQNKDEQLESAIIEQKVVPEDSLPSHVEVTWEEFKNPSAFGMRRLVVLKSNDIFSFTQNAILHFDGTEWRKILSTADCQIWGFDTDGQFLVTSMDTLGQDLLTKPKVFIFKMRRIGGNVKLTNLQKIFLPLSHTPSSILFVKPGIALLGGLLEFGILKFLPHKSNPPILVNIQAGTLQLTPNIRSYGFQKSMNKKYLIIRAQDAIASTLLSGLELEENTPQFNLNFLFKPEMLSTSNFFKKQKWNSFDIQHISMWDTTFYAAKISRSFLLVSDSRVQPPLQIFNRIYIREKQWLSVKNIGAIAVDFSKHLYVITQNGQLLRGELVGLNPLTREMNNPHWKWTVIGQLPISQIWEMRFIDPGTLLISGDVFIRVHINVGVQSIKTHQNQSISQLPEQSQQKIPTRRSPRNVASRNRSKTFLFNVLPPFDPGSTYGIGIGQLDPMNNVYIYLAEVYNKNRLFIIDKSFNFDTGGLPTVDYSEKRGVLGRVVSEKRGDRDMSLAINFGDVNEDGTDDIVMSYLDSTNALYLNDGKGFFRDVSRAFNLTQPIGRSECVLLADVNNDGYLDLFTTSSVNTNRLFINRNGGRFVETTIFSGLKTSGLGITAAFGDVNNDGFEDLYVGNWDAENYLYLNNGGGTFREASAERGLHFGALHKTNSVLMADFNNDGALDIFVGNRGVGNKLFLNNGSGYFRDVTRQAGIHDRAIVYGSVFGDFDNDGWLDLFLAAAGKVLFYRNTGVNADGVPLFVDATTSVLPSMRYYKGYNTGIATWDAEHDGDLDVLMGQFRGGSLIFRNIVNSPLSLLLQKEKVDREPPNFLNVSVEGVKSNHDGIGTKLWLYANEKLIGYREVASGYGYASSSSRVQHFGIPAVTKGEPTPQYRLVVKFPASGIQKELTVFPGQWVHVKEIKGLAANKILLKKTIRRILVNLPLFIGFSISKRAVELIITLIILIIILKSLSYFESRKGYLYLPKDQIFVLGLSVLIYLSILFILFIQKKFFMSTMEWTSGEGNAFLDHWIPISATIIGAIVLLRFKHKEISLRSLKAEIYDRLFDLLKKFRHGAGGYQNLNRLAFFAENVQDMFSSQLRNSTMSENSPLRYEFWRKIVRLRLSLKRASARVIFEKNIPDGRFQTMNPALRRFQDAIQEFREKTYPDMLQINALLKIISESNQIDMKLGASLREGNSFSRKLRKNRKIEQNTANINIDVLNIQTNQLKYLICKLQQMIDSYLKHKKPQFNSYTRLQKQMQTTIRDLQNSILQLIRYFDRWYVTDISELLVQVCRKYSTSPPQLKSENRKSPAEIVLEEKIPPTRVVVGKRDLEEVLSILIQNAIEAFGKIETSGQQNTIRIISEQEDSLIRILVEDNGPGIPKKKQLYLFQRGFTMKIGEHGYGLWHAREILSRYGGRIWYDNTYEGGARFVVELRLA